VLGENKRSLVTKRNWDVITQLWPALVQAQMHCEKPSVLRLFDDVIERLHSDIETTELSLVVRTL
jgi:proteasome activator subunit 4